MRKLLQRWLQRKTPEQTEAYQFGRQAGAAMAADIENTADQLLLERRRNFIAVLDGRLERIQDVTGVTYAQQAQIEFKIMLDSWTERMAEQESEVRAEIEQRWPKGLTDISEDLISQIIPDRVGWYYAQLFSEGLEHAADAVSIRAGAQKE